MKKKREGKTTSKIFDDHDHGMCFDDAIEQIENYFLKKNLQFTPLRRKVFEILIRDHKPLGAYEILEALGAGRLFVISSDCLQSARFSNETWFCSQNTRS